MDLEIFGEDVLLVEALKDGRYSLIIYQFDSYIVHNEGKTMPGRDQVACVYVGYGLSGDQGNDKARE